MVLSARLGLDMRRSINSPQGLSGDRVDCPTTEMFWSAKTRVSTTLITYLRRPGKVWAPAEPWWRDIGTICAGAPDAIVSIDDIGTRVRDRVEEYLPVLRPALQPAGRTLAGLPTVLLSRQPRSVGPVALDVLGHEVRLTATPRWRWGFDAGDDVVTAHPGSPWPAAPLTHVFAVPGRARVEVTTTWTATFTVEGFGPFDVPPPLVTQTARLAIVVAEGRAHLVG